MSGFLQSSSTVITLALTVAVALVAGCSTSMEEVKPLSERSLENSHLTPSVPDIVSSDEIPAPVSNEVYLPVPESKAPLELFTVSAADVPVADLLYSLARDASLQLDVFDGVVGNVTINAIDQTLPNILKRISDQAGLVFELHEDYLVVRPDKPIWRTYEVDYLNVERSVESQVVLNMSVSAGPGENEENDGGSQTSVNTRAQSRFWETLTQNLLAQVTTAKSERLVAQLGRMQAAQQSVQSAPQLADPEAGDEGTAGSSETESATASAAPSGGSDSTTEVSAANDVIVNREAGVVSIFTDTRTHEQIQSYLDRVMQRIRKEVLIEATIVEVELFDDYRSGVDWAALSENGNFKIKQSTIGSNFADIGYTGLGSGVAPDDLAANSQGTFGLFGGELAVNLQLVQRYGDTKVLSSPKIMAINNQTALLKVVDNYVYFGLTWERDEDDNGNVEITYESELNTVPVGLIMSVTPFISGNDEVTLSVRPTISRIVSFVEDPAVRLAAATLQNPEDVKSEVPLIREREMEAVLKVRNGQTAVIGGLMQDSDDSQREGLPGLERTPGIGDAFAFQGKKRRKSELVIFIRPIIVESPDVEHGDLKGFRQYLPGSRSPSKGGRS